MLKRDPSNICIQKEQEIEQLIYILHGRLAHVTWGVGFYMKSILK